MKNKIIVLGSLILALGLIFSSCDSAATFDKVKGVNKGDITVTKAFSATYSGTNARTVDTYYVSFTASADLAEYEIVFREDGKRSYISLTPARNNSVPNTTTVSGSFRTEWSANTDTDKWSAVFNTDAIPRVTGKIGVMARSYRNDQNPTITWTDNSVTGTSLN